MNYEKHRLDIDDEILETVVYDIRRNRIVRTEIELPQGAITVLNVHKNQFKTRGAAGQFFVDVYDISINGRVFERTWIYTKSTEEADVLELIKDYNKRFEVQEQELRERLDNLAKGQEKINELLIKLVETVSNK